EINEAAQLVSNSAAVDANIIFGAVIDDALGDEVRVTVIAAGLDAERGGRGSADAGGSSFRGNGSGGAASLDVSAGPASAPAAPAGLPFLRRPGAPARSQRACHPGDRPGHVRSRRAERRRSVR